MVRHPNGHPANEELTGRARYQAFGRNYQKVGTATPYLTANEKRMHNPMPKMKPIMIAAALTLAIAGSAQAQLPAFAPCKVATRAPQATIDTIDVNVDEKNAEKFLDFLFKHADSIVALKARLWPNNQSDFHIYLKGEDLQASVTGGKLGLACLSCASYYQSAAVLDGYFLVKTEFHHGTSDIYLQKLDKAQVLLSNPRKRSVQLR
jgi:hypothetical protein